MQRKRATGEEIVEHFDSLPRGAGTAEERVAATARYFKVTSAIIHRHLKFWWPGKKYLHEFGEVSRKPKWDRPTGELLKALNEEGSVSKAAKALGTTAVTLTKSLERHKIVQRWVVEGGESAAAGQDGSRSPRIRGRHPSAS